MRHYLFRTASRAFRTMLVLGSCTVFATHAAFAAGPAAAPAVVITKFAFAPQEITVTPGTRIVWTNRDESPHTVTSKDKSFTSKGLDTDDKYEYTFATEGDFTYYCTLHPFMSGVVHVRRQ